MNVSYDLTPDDVIAFWRMQHAQSPELRKQRRSLYGVIAVFVALPLWILVSSPKPVLETAHAIRPLLAFPVIVAVALPFSWWRRRRYWRRLLSEEQNKGFLGLCTMVLDDQGIRVSKPSGEGIKYWPAVEQILVSDAYLFLFTSSFDGYVVPRRAFQSDTEFNAFLENILVKSHVESKNV
ncbi:MAG: hypothetical protein JWN70_883 [Planctomycetaceae bacterium]|nr:hypothetical protein [Planctomycetaceae bacterium]